MNQAARKIERLRVAHPGLFCEAPAVVAGRVAEILGLDEDLVEAILAGDERRAAARAAALDREVAECDARDVAAQAGAAQYATARAERLAQWVAARVLELRAEGDLERLHLEPLKEEESSPGGEDHLEDRSHTVRRRLVATWVSPSGVTVERVLGAARHEDLVPGGCVDDAARAILAACRLPEDEEE